MLVSPCNSRGKLSEQVSSKYRLSVSSWADCREGKAIRTLRKHTLKSRKGGIRGLTIVRRLKVEGELLGIGGHCYDH